jgi:hypothetical protein
MKDESDEVRVTNEGDEVGVTRKGEPLKERI